MAIVSIAEARRQMEQLVERATAGETITISKWGKPLARLVPMDTRTDPHQQPSDKRS